MPELTRVAVSHEGRDDVEVHFEWNGRIEESNSVLWSVTFTSPEGHSRQLGYKIVDGQHSAQFVFNHTTARQTNFERDVDIVGTGSLTARFPYDLAADLGPVENCTWRGVLTIDGKDVSTFPGARRTAAGE